MTPQGLAVAGQRVVVANDRLPAEVSPCMAASCGEAFMRFVPDSFPGFRWRFWRIPPSVDTPYDAALHGLHQTKKDE
jgi:hypothetical protein